MKLKSLRPQLMLIVALALAPLAIASIVQGVMHVEARQSAIDDVLRQTASYATRNEQNTFYATARFLGLLAKQPELWSSPGECARTLKLASLGRVSSLNVSLVGPGGKTYCSSTGIADTADFSRLPWWPAVKKHDTAFVSQQMFSDAAQRNVLPMILPLHDASGAFTGALSAALDMRWVAQVSPYGRLPPLSMMLIVDERGDIVASNRSVPAELGVEVARLGGDQHQHTFRAADGTRWRWTGAPIANSGKVIAFAITEPMPYGVTQAYLIGNILLPILMVILASLAMWLGTERFVIRWTNYLKRVSAAYKQNHFALELTELEEAPDEFKLLGNEMKSMAASIRDRDRGLTAALEQKSAMAREIHHRIKNNLQIVASLISLYSQNVADREGRTAFSQILARVGALTLISRLMDMRETSPVVDMQRLLTELGDQMRAVAAENNIRYRLVMSVEDWLLPPDMATPVSFFAVEALALELFAPQKNGGTRNVALFFGADGPDHLLFWVEDGIFAAESVRTGRPPPDRIFAALAEQLKAEYWLEKTPDGKSRLSLRLPVRSGMQGAAMRAPHEANDDTLQPDRVRQDSDA
ncbi:MAG TPA: sensor histidine kinase [Rhizomicrobium sp.]|nr:sensor histidine kinase [Rhizomicrobium sp.]